MEKKSLGWEERIPVKCEKKCLYFTNVFDPFCDECEDWLKTMIGWRLSQAIWSRFEDEPQDNMYQNGIRQGLLHAQAIVRGQLNGYWVQ